MVISVLNKRKPVVVVGIDLAGSPRRPTGLCLLRGLTAHTFIAFNDEDILRLVETARPMLVPIDAPLSLPNGRTSIHDRAGDHLRDCDRELLRRGIRFFPITLGPMRMLTARGLALKDKIEAMGYQPVECYPGGAQDVWSLPRQHQNRSGLLSGLRRLGIKGLNRTITGDELDAATAALVGRWLLLGKGCWLGGENGILLPSASTADQPESSNSELTHSRVARIVRSTARPSRAGSPGLSITPWSSKKKALPE